MNSYEVNCEAAGKIDDEKLLAVDVHKPDAVINIEIREKCYVYCNQNTGCRGLPVGSSGRGLLLLSGGLDSPVAGYRMMRRGMYIDCAYFHSYPAFGRIGTEDRVLSASVDNKVVVEGAQLLE